MQPHERRPSFPAACTCWVRTLPPEEAFAIRYSAHSVTCPVYRPSADPVDRAQDDALWRARGF